MKRLLNTLFVTTQKMYLKKQGETLVVKLGKETKLQLPLINLSGIVCFGNIGISPFLLGQCAKCGVSISFLSEYGKFLARVQGPVSGNVLLRRSQYRITDDPVNCSAIVRNIVIGKISNCRTVLQRALRDHSGKINEDTLRNAVNELERSLIMQKIAVTRKFCAVSKGTQPGVISVFLMN